MAYCVVPQISTGPYHEEIAYKIKFNVGKTCSITKEGATPPITISITRKGAAPLTHSLFGRYSASLSFPLVSPGKRERVPSCIVQQEQVHGSEDSVKPAWTWRLGVRSIKDAEPSSRPLSYNRVGQSRKRTDSSEKQLIQPGFFPHPVSLPPQFPAHP